MLTCISFLFDITLFFSLLYLQYLYITSSVHSSFRSCAGFPVHITQSRTMESMSFTYQRSSTSVRVGTKPSRTHLLFNSDSDTDSEEEPIPRARAPTDPDSDDNEGDIAVQQCAALCDPITCRPWPLSNTCFTLLITQVYNCRCGIGMAWILTACILYCLA